MKKLIGMIGSVVALCAYADGTVVLKNCSTTVTDTASAPFGESAITLKGASLQFAPALASGEVWSGTLGEVKSDAGANRLDVSRGNGADATVTLAALSSSSYGATTVISAGNGALALGDLEKVVVSGQAAVENVSPAMVTRSWGSANSPYYPLTYDADNGYKAVDFSAVPEATGSGTFWSGARVTKSVKFSGDTKIYQHLYVTSTGTVELASGKTMTLYN